MRVLVLDGESNPAVSCVRSLARAGHVVSVGSTSIWSKAGWSRYCHEAFTYPDPKVDSISFVTRVAEVASRHPGTLVIPVNESTVLAVSGHRQALQSVGARIVMPSHASMLAAVDKRVASTRASEAGIAVPETVVVADESDVDSAARTVRYPVALKAKCSEELCDDGSIRPTPRPLYAQTPEQLRKNAVKLLKQSSFVLVQRFIYGPQFAYNVLLRNGELRAEFTHQQIRFADPTGCGPCMRVSTATPPRIREAGMAVMRAIDPEWSGLACIEFRLAADGKSYFLEVNPRVWWSMALAVYAGIDFPAKMAEMAETGDTPVADSYKTDVYCRWWLGEFKHLARVLWGVPREYPVHFGRWAAVQGCLSPVRGTFHDNFELRDPLPGIGDWLGAMYRTVLRTPRRSPARTAKHATATTLPRLTRRPTRPDGI